MPTTVVLLMRIGVGGRGFPNSMRASHMICTPFAYKKSVPSLDSATNEATHLKIAQTVCMAPGLVQC